MKEFKAKYASPLIVAACIAACAPAWSQEATQGGNADTSNAAVLKRIDEMTRQIEELKAQVKANDERLNAAACIFRPDQRGRV